MAAKHSDIGPLELSIGHKFENPHLAHLALTHISAASSREKTYQRLEFLGDRVLGLVVAEMLYAAFPMAEEGELSRRLADLVRRDHVLARCPAYITAKAVSVLRRAADRTNVCESS